MKQWLPGARGWGEIDYKGATLGNLGKVVGLFCLEHVRMSFKGFFRCINGITVHFMLLFSLPGLGALTDVWISTYTHIYVLYIKW